jgi:hypothetical protein
MRLDLVAGKEFAEASIRRGEKKYRTGSGSDRAVAKAIS